MSKNLSKSFTPLGTLFSICVMIVQFCPYLFITFPLFLLVFVIWSIEFYRVLVLQSDEYKNYSVKSRLFLSLLCLFVLVLLSYVVFNSPSFKAFTPIK